MTKEEKNKIIDGLTETLTAAGSFYIADTSALDSEVTSELRRTCFKNNIELTVVKNTLLRKALEKVEGIDFSEVYDSLHGPTALMICETMNAPAKMIKQFRVKNPKPILKAAYVQESFYIGDDQLQALIDIKSKEELVGDIIALLQSPARNVISALQSGGQTIAGLVKTLSEK
jgi:large subunit ribosomal protein L10